MKTPVIQDQVVRNFLRESNAIENVWDTLSLADALHAWEYLISKKNLTVDVVLTTHKFLMVHQPLDESERGYYRKIAVRVGNSFMDPWEIIPARMDAWIEVMNAEPSSKESWKNLHVIFEEIHPFVDGNGRAGRMFMNWYRLRNGERIYVIKESEKHKYYRWFAAN